MNERLTEQIVRAHFEESKRKGDCGVFHVSEQMPDNARIRRQLAKASKSGGGEGHPEFIVDFGEYQDFLMVVECKADIAHHESENRDKPAAFAVDGVLHYAKHLSREFNVLAVAVSGVDKSALRVGHFMQFKGESKAEDAKNLFGNSLRPLADYLAGYRDHDKLLKQDLNNLLLFTKELNGRLHSLKVKEAHRSLLISAILMALQDKGFARSYQQRQSQDILLKSIKDTMLDSMRSAGIQNETVRSIEASYGFMSAPGKLTEGRVLSDLVKEIDDEINSFQKTHKYHDILGRLYIEFLRYSNSDKGLGIVLTPPHITQLAVELAQVGKDDVLYDNCAGTGGFLISGMKRMIRSAEGDSQKIAEIKDRGIVGVEIQPDIVSLLCSNMFIHGDGKSNVFQGDCFAAIIHERIKNDFHPTVGFLNPPFKGEKDDAEEMDFVLNNLESLKPKGRCIALLPMQYALSRQGRQLALKSKILENHTLDAVLSLPDDIFHNSKVGVVTCLMAFTAHQPHSGGKKTWFGYCKNDGFAKKKPHGRVDLYSRWADIKESWVAGYINRETTPGFSVMKEIRAGDEWCAEAYIETDYAKLVREDGFLNTLKNYATFRISREIWKVSTDTRNLPVSLSPRPIEKAGELPDAKAWKEFRLDDLFVVMGSKTTSLEELESHGKGNYPYVTTQAVNNGVAEYYDYFTEKGGVIAVDSAVLGFASYQPDDFSASDHVEKLKPKFEMSAYMAMFIVAVLNANQFRYNYGRKASQSRIRSQTVKLPTAANGRVDFALMEKYIKSLPLSSAI